MAHGSARSSREANVAAKRVLAAYDTLREQGAEVSLLVLLEDQEPAVRCWAASHLLDHAPERALVVLKELSEGPPGPQRADAALTLREWRRKQSE